MTSIDIFITPTGSIDELQKKKNKGKITKKRIYVHEGKGL